MYMPHHRPGPGQAARRRRGAWIVAGAALLLLGHEPGLGAEIRVDLVDYHDGATALQGYLAYDDSLGVERRPALLIAPEWRGLDDYAKSRARQFAALGYLAFALDPYGKGVVVASDADAKSRSALLKADRTLLRARGRAALDALLTQPLAARDSIAAIGYCFGGTLVLELARSGADIRAAIAVHGGLAAGTDAKGVPLPAQTGVVTAKIMALQGGDDPFVTQAELTAFTDEMRAAKVDWQLMEFGGAVHAFSNPHAGSDPSSGRAYNAVADHRSMDIICHFLADLFPR